MYRSNASTSKTGPGSWTIDLLFAGVNLTAKSRIHNTRATNVTEIKTNRIREDDSRKDSSETYDTEQTFLIVFVSLRSPLFQSPMVTSQGRHTGSAVTTTQVTNNTTLYKNVHLKR